MLVLQTVPTEVMAMGTCTIYWWRSQIAASNIHTYEETWLRYADYAQVQMLWSWKMLNHNYIIAQLHVGITNCTKWSYSHGYMHHLLVKISTAASNIHRMLATRNTYEETWLLITYIVAGAVSTFILCIGKSKVWSESYNFSHGTVRWQISVEYNKGNHSHHVHQW